jgi:hypothetical protein
MNFYSLTSMLLLSLFTDLAARLCSAEFLLDAAVGDEDGARVAWDHHPHWRERLTEPAPLKADATPMQAMTHRLSTIAGKAAYAIRNQTVVPVFGIIKSVRGFRHFSLRGLHKVTGERNLVCLAWNVKRMVVLRPKVGSGEGIP